MKLLFEEFFGKVFKLSESGSWHLKMLITVINVFIVVGILFFIFYSFIMGRYFLLLVVLGFVIIAESAHFVRKSREHNLGNKIAGRKATKELINPKKAKNEVLLKCGGVKNKELLGRKVGNGKKVVGSEKVGNGKKVKNKGLLGLNKTKNKKLLNSK